MPATTFTQKTLTLSSTPRDYQEQMVGDVFKQLDDAETDSPALLYASPTGTGKSVMELTLLTYLADFALVTPRLEIVADMLRKGGVDTTGWNDDRLASEALQYRITTPIRFRNMLAKGDLPWRPAGIIWDEGHHRSAASYQDIRAYLGPVPEIALTASPFRGTPKGTEEFLNSFDSLTWVLTYPGAAERGYIAVPQCSMWPLADDDELEVSNGEITVRSAEEVIRPRLDEVVDRCRAFQRFRGGYYSHLAAAGHGGEGVASWDRPTIFSVPSTDVARELAVRLEAAGLPARAVTQDTPRPDRVRIFAACEAANVAIVQIDVVSEGVDLKLRRLIDLRPTLSPVKWLQQVGRITRPLPQCGVGPGHADSDCPFCRGTGFAEPAPEYICTNRNLERHCYLYDGLIPPAAVAIAQQAFERPSKRAGARVVGTENLGRFQAAELPLADGTTGIMYQLTTVENLQKHEYAILLHPCSSQPLYATRTNTRDGEHVAYGKWQACEKLPDFRGFSSAPAKSLSEKQRLWWQRAAKARGLDPAGDVTRRNFCALPVLLDLGVTLKAGA